jgi:hypothetical protein
MSRTSCATDTRNGRTRTVARSAGLLLRRARCSTCRVRQPLAPYSCRPDAPISPRLPRSHLWRESNSAGALGQQDPFQVLLRPRDRHLAWSAGQVQIGREPPRDPQADRIEESRLDSVLAVTPQLAPPKRAYARRGTRTAARRPAAAAVAGRRQANTKGSPECRSSCSD